MGRSPARDNKGIEGIGFSKKRMPLFNGLDRGSNFASIRKDADCVPRKAIKKMRDGPSDSLYR